MTKKTMMCAAVAALMTTPAMAGGLLTNTNQNAAFLRNFAQEGQIDITSIYANPAASAFFQKGWHLSVNSQTAFQERNVSTTFPLFVMNDKNPTHEFKGTASAPVIPSFTVAYTHDKWSLSAHFGLTGGGGKCEFANGLGSFEALYAGTMYKLVPGMVEGGVIQNIMALYPGMPIEKATEIAEAPGSFYKMTGYSMDKYMKGTSYYFGLQVGGTYKATENLAFYGGIRFLYATTNYQGYVRNLSANYAFQAPGAGITETQYGRQSLPNDLYGIELNCDQSSFGVTPILGVDWKINDQWNVSAKYEFKTRIRLDNSTSKYVVPETAKDNATIAQFENGKTIKDDVPGLLALGVQYKPIKTLMLNFGYHWYEDSKATKNNDMHNYVNDSHEIMAGAEWRFCKWVSGSISWQKTMYDMQDKFMNDVSFNNSSNSLGLGFRVHATEKINIDLGYMHTMYQDKTVNQLTEAGVKSDTYSRKNDVFGVGVNFAF